MEKSRARLFAPLRCAQDDSREEECTDVTLSGATDPLKAKDVPGDVLESALPAPSTPASMGVRYSSDLWKRRTLITSRRIAMLARAATSGQSTSKPAPFK